MVLLVLALVWGALLISWLRSRSVNTLGDSVGTFRRHLTVLERATPGGVLPANRLRDGARPGSTPARRGAPAPLRGTRIGGPVALARPATGPGRISRPMAANAAVLRRRQIQKRRRDVFIALVAGAVGSLFLAFIAGTSVMWPVQVLFDLLLAGYVGLLVRLRNLAAERELKLRFIPTAHRGGARSGYDFAGGYGDVEFRRAAN